MSTNDKNSKEKETLISNRNINYVSLKVTKNISIFTKALDVILCICWFYVYHNKSYRINHVSWQCDQFKILIFVVKYRFNFMA